MQSQQAAVQRLGSIRSSISQILVSTSFLVIGLSIYGFLPGTLVRPSGSYWGIYRIIINAIMAGMAHRRCITNFRGIFYIALNSAVELTAIGINLRNNMMSDSGCVNDTRCNEDKYGEGVIPRYTSIALFGLPWIINVGLVISILVLLAREDIARNTLWPQGQVPNAYNVVSVPTTIVTNPTHGPVNGIIHAGPMTVAFGPTAPAMPPSNLGYPPLHQPYSPPQPNGKPPSEAASPYFKNDSSLPPPYEYNAGSSSGPPLPQRR